MSELRPLFARVLLKREKPKDIRGIVLPEQYKKKHAPTIGVCIAKGPTADESVEVGNTYLFGQHAGAWINAEGKAVLADDDTAEYFICQDEDLLVEVHK